MILEIKYIGPFPEVIPPGMHGGTTVGPGGICKISIDPGIKLGGCWEIVSGAKEYEAGIKAAQKEADARAAAQKKARADALERVEKANAAATGMTMPETTAAAKPKINEPEESEADR